jgi:putative FmdB family regulatory protein
MPTYEYICRACEHQWEEFQPITSKPTKKCPSCGKNKAERLISAGGALIFKGSGFYCTDYRSKSYKEAAKAEKAASDTPKSTSSSSTAAITAGSSKASAK